jgi:hypothetical protein
MVHVWSHSIAGRVELVLLDGLLQLILLKSLSWGIGYLSGKMVTLQVKRDGVDGRVEVKGTYKKSVH